LGALAAAAGAAPFSVPTDYEGINRPRPELVVSTPFFPHEGERIKGVRYSVDGSWHEEQCSAEDRDSDGKTCGKPIPIDPGAPVLAVVICTHPQCLGFGKAWNVELRFTVGVRERVTIDLARLASAATDDDAVARAPLGGAPRSPCAAAVEQAFYVNT